MALPELQEVSYFPNETRKAESDNWDMFRIWKKRVGDVLSFDFSETKAVACKELISWNRKTILLREWDTIEIVSVDDALIFLKNEIRYQVDACVQHRELSIPYGKGNFYRSFSATQNFHPGWFTK